MKIVSRMVFAQIMKSSLFVLLTLVALFAFFDLIGQSGNIGTSYSMGQAFLLATLSRFLEFRASGHGDSAGCFLCRVLSW